MLFCRGGWLLSGYAEVFFFLGVSSWVFLLLGVVVLMSDGKGTKYDPKVVEALREKALLKKDVS